MYCHIFVCGWMDDFGSTIHKMKLLYGRGSWKCMHDMYMGLRNEERGMCSVRVE